MSNSSPYLDPLSKKLIESSPPIPADISIKEFREIQAQLGQHKQLPGVEREKHMIPVQGGVETWIYKPEGHEDALLPFLYYIHGGGFVARGIDSYDGIATDLVLRTGFALVFPEYSLAPEVTFPTQHEECYAVLKWMTQHGKSKGLEQSNVAVVGDSAGGHLGAGMSILSATRKPRLPIRFNVLICPMADADTSGRATASEFAFFDGPLLTVPLLKRATELYMPRAADRASELANPRAMSDGAARLFPPTLIVTSSADMLRSEGELLGRRLQEAGRECAVVRGEGQVHDTVALTATRDGPTPRALMDMIAARLHAALRPKVETGRKRRRAAMGGGSL